MPVGLTVEIKLRFQNVSPHEIKKPTFLNSFGLKNVFEKLCFRDGLVRTVDLTVEIKLTGVVSAGPNKTPKPFVRLLDLLVNVLLKNFSFKINSRRLDFRNLLSELSISKCNGPHAAQSRQ